jgi:hypothetical protein
MPADTHGATQASPSSIEEALGQESPVRQCGPLPCMSCDGDPHVTETGPSPRASVPFAQALTVALLKPGRARCCTKRETLRDRGHDSPGDREETLSSISASSLCQVVRPRNDNQLSQLGPLVDLGSHVGHYLKNSRGSQNRRLLCGKFRTFSAGFAKPVPLKSSANPRGPAAHLLGAASLIWTVPCKG